MSTLFAVEKNFEKFILNISTSVIKDKSITTSNNMSSFGTLFKVTTYGESHCKSVGCIVDGCPPGMSLTEADIQPQLTRRRPGQSKLSTPRDEKDLVEIQSGTENGLTLGSPIGMIVRIKIIVLVIIVRPICIQDQVMPIGPIYRNTEPNLVLVVVDHLLGRVAAGAIAEKILAKVNNVEIVAFVSAIGEISMNKSPQDAKFQELLNTITREQVDGVGPIRCPDANVREEMVEVIEKYRDAKDSIGGVVTCVIRNCPIGLGEPCFDKLEAKLAHAMLSLPATKGLNLVLDLKVSRSLVQNITMHSIMMKISED